MRPFARAYATGIGLPPPPFPLPCPPLTVLVSGCRFDPQPNVTVFPSALAQAASFDLGLVTRISTATALEGRIVNQVNYVKTGA